MRKDPYEPTRRTKKHTDTEGTTPKRDPDKVINFFGDNPPIRIEITYKNGEKDILKSNEIDADNPIVQALAHIRTCRRFWTDPTMPAGKQAWSTDEELLDIAARLGISVPDLSAAEKAAKVAEKLGMTSKYFLTGDDGEPLQDERGFWTEANPATAGSYTPGTHAPS